METNDKTQALIEHMTRRRVEAAIAASIHNDVLEWKAARMTESGLTPMRHLTNQLMRSTSAMSYTIQPGSTVH